MTEIIIIVVIGTIIWVGFDSANIIKDLPPKERKNIGGFMTPWEWVICSLALWIFFFPYYLAKRSKARKYLDRMERIKNRCPSCDMVFEPGSKFCQNCGAKLF